MNKIEFRDAIRSLLDQTAELSLDEKLAIIQQCCVDQQATAGFDESNKGKPWTDDELRIVLQHAPTRENCIRLARAYRRGYGSIEQIYRWAAASASDVEAKRHDDSFVLQIKRVAKQLGWRAVG